MPHRLRKRVAGEVRSRQSSRRPASPIRRSSWPSSAHAGTTSSPRLSKCSSEAFPPQRSSTPPGPARSRSGETDATWTCHSSRHRTWPRPERTLHAKEQTQPLTPGSLDQRRFAPTGRDDRNGWTACAGTRGRLRRSTHTSYASTAAATGYARSTGCSLTSPLPTPWAREVRQRRGQPDGPGA
jgi:hypothetical protein